MQKLPEAKEIVSQQHELYNFNFQVSAHYNSTIFQFLL